jgi:hypothetical protein
MRPCLDCAAGAFPILVRELPAKSGFAVNRESAGIVTASPVSRDEGLICSCPQT